jgi:hypothetical protein
LKRTCCCPARWADPARLPARLRPRFQPVGLPGRRVGDYAPISAKLFCKHSQVAFVPYGLGLQDERRTSNNDVAPLRNLISFVFKNPRSKLECLFLFLHLFPFNVRCWTFDVRCSSFLRAAFLPDHMSVSSSFPIQHSMLDVRCSMFIFSVPPGQKQLSA